MSATNKTPNMELPEFLPNDKPAWLVDWNGAMSTIDTYCGNLNQQTVVANANANAALAKANEVESGLDSADSKIAALENDITQINTAYTFTYIAGNTNNNTSINANKTVIAIYGGKLAKIEINVSCTAGTGMQFEPVKSSSGQQLYGCRAGQVPANIFNLPVGTFTDSAPSENWFRLGTFNGRTNNATPENTTTIVGLSVYGYWNGSNTEFFYTATTNIANLNAIFGTVVTLSTGGIIEANILDII